MMRRILLFVTMIVPILASCTKEQPKREAYKLNILDASYIFKTSSSKAMDAGEEGYWKMTVDGVLEALTLQDQSEDPIESSVTSIWELGDNFLGMDCDNTRFRNLFVDKKTGKVYSYPDNVTVPPFSMSDYNLKAWSIECNDKLYLKGKNRIGDYTHFIVEVDVKNQSSTRCTPDNLSATDFTIGKDGLIAFGADGYRFVMTPEKKLKRFGKPNEVHIFNDKDRNLFVFSFVENPYSEHNSFSIERLYLDNDEIKNEFVCEFEADTYDFPPYTSINSQNGNVMLFGMDQCIYEFNGKSVKKVSDISPDWRKVDGKGFEMHWVWPDVVHNYYFEFPSDNFFVKEVNQNQVTLQHLDLKTYELITKTFELYPKSEYTISGNVKHNSNRLTYSCVRFSDSHTVSFSMDLEGNRQIINDNGNSFSVSQFLMLN